MPATIGIIRGRVHVGLAREQLELLATSKEPCIKTSRRDLPYVLSKVTVNHSQTVGTHQSSNSQCLLSQKLNGGTTVSGTMLIAAKAGIPIFVTGECVHVTVCCSMNGASSKAVGRAALRNPSAAIKGTHFARKRGSCP